MNKQFLDKKKINKLHIEITLRISIFRMVLIAHRKNMFRIVMFRMVLIERGTLETGPNV